jgi:DNA repair protein RecN (Recombination protein N)
MEIPVEDQRIILQRKLSKNGKSSCRINGVPATLGQLKNLGGRLVDVCGQHDHVSLLDPQNHISILDAMGTDPELKQSYKKNLFNYTKVCADLEKLDNKESEIKQKREFYEFQLKELKKADLKQGEEESLKKSLSILENREKLYELCASALSSLSDNQNSAAEAVNRADHTLEQASSLDRTLKEAHELLKQCQFNLEECVTALNRYFNSLSQPRGDLDETNSRLMEISRFKKKYGMDIDGIINYRQKIETELSHAENFDLYREKLCGERNRLLEALNQSAGRLTDSRNKTMSRADGEINRYLKKLGMPGAVFRTRNSNLKDFQPRGRDEIEFMIQANTGEPFKPLSRIASGGEISRVMLAVKSILSDRDQICTLIFDEVDSGIGGRVANNVGAMLRQLSASHQIICITHLHQIASRGENHLAVNKITKENRTLSRIHTLDRDDRVRELARMMGDDKSQKILAHARELVK